MKHSIVKIEYFSSILVLDLMTIGYMLFVENEHGMFEMRISLLDSNASMVALIQSSEDSKAESLQKTFLDLQTKWQNFKKNFMISPSYEE